MIKVIIVFGMLYFAAHAPHDCFSSYFIIGFIIFLKLNQIFRIRTVYFTSDIFFKYFNTTRIMILVPFPEISLDSFKI